MTGRSRQEVANVYLAGLLRDRGIDAQAERRLRHLVGVNTTRMPDVMVFYRGLRTMLEGEYHGPDAQRKALESATERVQEGIAHIGIAVVYPRGLQNLADDAMKTSLATATLEIAIVTEAGTTGFAHATVDELASTLRSTFDQLVKEDVVVKAVAQLQTAIARFTYELQPHQPIIQRMAVDLGMREAGTSGIPPLSADRQKEVCQVGGLVLINAMIFQEILAGVNSQVKSVGATSQRADCVSAFLQEWGIILRDINYTQIFGVAQKLLNSVTTAQGAALKILARTATTIVSQRAALRHDLMGRIYHRLLVDQKYLGTYYTGIPAAVLLLKVALHKFPAGMEWHDLTQIEGLRIADLACGTGTLLMATAEAATDNYIEASTGHGDIPVLGRLQQILAENVLYGYDVMTSAIHLTAATLAIRAPDTVFQHMNMFVMPLGGTQHRLGSIEYLETSSIQLTHDIFGSIEATQRISGEAISEMPIAPMPDLDLCVMNPPFVRSVGGNQLFGSYPAERAAMQARLAKMLRQQGVFAKSTAGLGAVFVAVGHRYLKPGGRLALVLPKAVISGVAWGETRELLKRNYTLEYIIASHDPAAWNFSESTSLSEVLLIARKNDPATPNRGATTVGVNLWHNPDNAFEALATAASLLSSTPPNLTQSQGSQTIYIGEAPVGQATALAWDDLKAQVTWLLPAAFAQIDLIRAGYHLLKGEIWTPGTGLMGKVPLTSLKNLGTLGFDRRDIHDAFDTGAPTTRVVTPHAAFWDHKTQQVVTLLQAPNRYLSPLGHAKPGRPLRSASDLWQKAGTLLIAERVRLNNARLLAIRVEQQVLSNVWWTVRLNDAAASTEHEKALALWLNSTWGILLLLLHREETEGAWVEFKKPTLAEMPILDVRNLTPTQRQNLAAAFDRLASQEFASIPQLATDSTRGEVDHVLTTVLGLPDPTILRTLLAQEPGISAKPIGSWSHQSATISTGDTERPVSRTTQVPVTSQVIAAIGYDLHNQALEITFHNGSMIQYLDVPKETYEDLVAASSKGQYYTSHIRGKFESYPLAEPPEHTTEVG